MDSHHTHTWTMYAPSNVQSSHLRTDNVRSLLDGLVLLRQGFHDGLDDLCGATFLPCFPQRRRAGTGHGLKAEKNAS